MSLLGRIRRMLGRSAPLDDERAQKAREINAQTVKSDATLRRVEALRGDPTIRSIRLQAQAAQHRLDRQ